MKGVALEELLACAVGAARAAGDYALAHRARRHEVAERAAHDVKLALDHECQKLAQAIIHQRFPDHLILGEEGRAGPAGGELCWIVDPLDGTVNFSHGLPQWCTSVAVARAPVGAGRLDEGVLAAAVYVPVANELFTATVETPARCNGEVIRPSEVRSLSEALVLTGVSKNISETPRAFSQFERLARAAQKVRVMGAAALDICHVACGRADGYVEASIYVWDVAAAGLIARQAGARAEVLRRYDDVHLQYLCSNGLIHEELKQLVLREA